MLRTRLINYCASFYIFVGILILLLYHPEESFWLSVLAKRIVKRSSIFRQPYLFSRETTLFFKYLNKSTIYFEYRSGGSTHQAAKRGMKIYTVEIGSPWITQMQKEIEVISSHLQSEVDITYLLADLQSKENITYQDFLTYVQMYDQKYNADFIFIDGDYLMSCLFNLFNQIDSNTFVFIHDMDLLLKPRSIKLMETYFDVVDHCDRSYVLTKKKESKPLSNELLDEIFERDFKYTSKKIRMVSFLKQLASDIVEKYRNYDDYPMDTPPSKQVWLFWWQGLEAAPEIVKLCYSAIQKNIPNATVTLITQDNILDYVSIPSYIFDYVKTNRLTLISFSDCLRMSLLAQKGGLWIDSTVFVGKEQREFFDYQYYTIRFADRYKYVTGKWCTFLSYSVQNHIVPTFVSEVILEYMKHYDHFIEYFLLDFIHLLGYDYIPSFRRAVQSVPYNNHKVLKMWPRLNNSYSPRQLDFLLSDSALFKLSYKQPLRKTIGDSKTLYGHLYEKYLN